MWECSSFICFLPRPTTASTSCGTCVMAAPAEGVAYPRDAPAEPGMPEGWKGVEKMADAEQTQKQKQDAEQKHEQMFDVCVCGNGVHQTFVHVFSV